MYTPLNRDGSSLLENRAPSNLDVKKSFGLNGATGVNAIQPYSPAIPLKRTVTAKFGNVESEESLRAGRQSATELANGKPESTDADKIMRRGQPLVKKNGRERSTENNQSFKATPRDDFINTSGIVSPNGEVINAKKDPAGFKISNKWLRNVHMLLLTIAEHESNIEEARQDLAALTEFSPKRLFNHIDEENDDKITVDEMVQFMFDNGIQGNDTNEEIVREIIQEFDTDLDGTLNYDEFLNIFLPSTNEKLRSVCIRRAEIDQH